MYTLRREVAYDDEVRYDLVDSRNEPLIAYVYPLRITPTYALAEDPRIKVTGSECELVTEWFSLGLVR